MNAPATAMIQHVIQADFVNSASQHVYVLDCPVANATVAVTAPRYAGVCTCGAKI